MEPNQSSQATANQDPMLAHNNQNVGPEPNKEQPQGVEQPPNEQLPANEEIPSSNQPTVLSKPAKNNNQTIAIVATVVIVVVLAILAVLAYKKG
jgi:hypothetical protein